MSQHCSKEANGIWQHVMEREAVNQLLLNKDNVNIQLLRAGMTKIIEKDQDFEIQLFNVSNQGRDAKNYVTFDLKQEYNSWFDPYSFLEPKKHSKIYQMFE